MFTLILIVYLNGESRTEQIPNLTKQSCELVAKKYNEDRSHYRAECVEQAK